MRRAGEQRAACKPLAVKRALGLERTEDVAPGTARKESKSKALEGDAFSSISKIKAFSKQLVFGLHAAACGECDARPEQTEPVAAGCRAYTLAQMKRRRLGTAISEEPPASISRRARQVPLSIANVKLNLEVRKTAQKHIRYM